MGLDAHISTRDRECLAKRTQHPRRGGVASSFGTAMHAGKGNQPRCVPIQGRTGRNLQRLLEGHAVGGLVRTTQQACNRFEFGGADSRVRENLRFDGEGIEAKLYPNMHGGILDERDFAIHSQAAPHFAIDYWVQDDVGNHVRQPSEGKRAFHVAVAQGKQVADQVGGAHQMGAIGEDEVAAREGSEIGGIGPEQETFRLVTGNDPRRRRVVEQRSCNSDVGDATRHGVLSSRVRVRRKMAGEGFAGPPILAHGTRLFNNPNWLITGRSPRREPVRAMASHLGFHTKE